MLKNKIRKVMSIVLSAAIALSSLVGAITVSAENKTFELGNMSCVLSDDGTLTVSGSGTMTNVVGTKRPWSTGSCSASDIKKIIISDGITYIRNFSDLTDLIFVEIAESVDSIGANTFNGCTNPDLVIDIKGKITMVNSTKPFGDVVGTIYVYDTDSYNLVSSRATTAKVELKANTDNLKKDLQKVVDGIKAQYPEWYYTEESYKELKNRITAAEDVIAKPDASADDISNASNSLNVSKYPTLYSNFVSKIQAAIDEAKKVDTSSNTASTAAVLAEAIKKAQEVADKGVKTDTNVNGADQKEVTEAIEAINTAKDGLKAKASAEKVKEFEAHYVKAIRSNLGYTEESWAEYEKVLAEYLKVYEIRNTEANDEQIDAAMKSLDEAEDKLVETRDYTEYEKAKKAVEDFLEANAKGSKYTTGSIDYVQRVYDNQIRRVEKDGEYIEGILQVTIDDVTKSLKGIIDPESLALKGDVTNLAKLVEEGTALIESDYTSDSWKTFTEQMAAAEALVNDPDNAGVDAIKAAEEAVRKAIDTLVINYSYNNGEEVPAIGYIQKGGATLVIDKGTADDELAGTAAIRVVFDCAADVNFNPWAAIEIKALVDGVESYKKFEGTDNTETNGTKDWSVELALTNPIASGNSYELSGFTYAWNGAADYVYAITKVEYLDADGKVLKTVSGANETAKLDEFNETVDAAKALIESGNYTDDSIKALEEAVAKADALLTESNGKPLPSKMPEIVEAIEAAKNTLELKPADYTAVDEAIANVPEDLSVYTEESVKALNDAVDAVVRDKDITEQATVDGYAQAINDAISALEYLAADYTKVDEAIAKVPADLSIYTDETAAAVTAAVEAVDRTKNITEQETVDGYAKAIEDAIAALVEKPTEVTTGEPITNEPTGDVTTGTDDQPTTKAPTGGKDTTKAPSTTVAPTTTAPAKGNNNGSATDKPVNTGAQAAVGLSAFLAAAAIGLVALKKRNK